MRSLELKVPPVAVVLLAGAGMWLLARALPTPGFHVRGQVGIALLLAAVGVAVAVWGVATFRRAGTTVNPMAPEAVSSLVTTGIYRLTRNPMYLGMLLVLGGWAAWLGSAAALVGLPAFVLYMNRFQIGPEERALAEKFGAELDAYRRRVRRWL